MVARRGRYARLDRKDLLVDAAIAVAAFAATVKTHLKRMLAKLQVRDRVQAVIFAYESGLTHPRPGLDG